jgi:hypothetical protein
MRMKLRTYEQRYYCCFQRTTVRCRVNSQLFARSVPPKHHSPIQRQSLAHTALCFGSCIDDKDWISAVHELLEIGLLRSSS